MTERSKKLCVDCDQRFWCANAPLMAEAGWVLAGGHGVAPKELEVAVARASCIQQGGFEPA